jgi:hypothetical protein
MNDVVHPDDANLIKLYPSSSYYVSKTRFLKSVKTDSFTSYVSKIFTALFKLDEVYRCTISGDNTNQLRKKRKLDEVKLNELYRAVEFHYKDKISNQRYKSKIDNVVRAKLNNLDLYFRFLQDGGAHSAANFRAKHLITLDFEEFDGFENFLNEDPIFDELDDRFFGDENQEIPRHNQEEDSQQSHELENLISFEN